MDKTHPLYMSKGFCSPVAVGDSVLMSTCCLMVHVTSSKPRKKLEKRNNFNLNKIKYN